MNKINPIKSEAIKVWYRGAKIMVVTARYTEASKIQAYGPIMPKYDFKLSIMFQCYQNLLKPLVIVCVTINFHYWSKMMLLIADNKHLGTLYHEFEKHWL